MCLKTAGCLANSVDSGASDLGLHCWLRSVSVLVVVTVNIVVCSGLILYPIYHKYSDRLA